MGNMWKLLWAKLNSDVSSAKTTIATNLTDKGVAASGSETLASLSAKIADIEVGGGIPEILISPTLIIPNHPTVSVATSVAAI